MIKPIRGKSYMLVIIDRFSRWIEAIPSADQGSRTVIKFLTKEVIPRFGITSKISSDNGSAFIQKVVKTIIQQLSMKQRLGCVYHPQSQGLVERANGTINGKIIMSCRMENNRSTYLSLH